MNQLVSERFEILSLGMRGDNIFETELPKRVALVLGNETAGISKQVLSFCTRTISIPLQNGIESLNVAASAAVACYEIARRN